MDLHDFRREYQQGGLRRNDLLSNPIDQFQKWFDELLTVGVTDPTAMILATVDSQHFVDQRIVLLKQVDQKGFVFFTNYTSNKGRDIEINNRVSLHFPWHSLERQVIVSGVAKKLSHKENQHYFASRPIESQWAAWASQQSRPIGSRKELMVQYEKIKARYPDSVPIPDFWGGYCVEPINMEFWQGGEQRLHDRYRYQKRSTSNELSNINWTLERLSP